MTKKKQQKKSYWVRDTGGTPSASLTMALIAFLSVTLWLLVWLIASPFGVTVPLFEASTAMTYLTPILALYFSRRLTSKSDEKNKTTETTIGEKE